MSNAAFDKLLEQLNRAMRVAYPEREFTLNLRFLNKTKECQLSLMEDRSLSKNSEFVYAQGVGLDFTTAATNLINHVHEALDERIKGLKKSKQELIQCYDLALGQCALALETIEQLPAIVEPAPDDKE